MWETSARLTSVAPLKPGESHCAFCAGYGAQPINKNDPTRTQFVPERCTYCNGTGKIRRLTHDDPRRS
jgi:DnaJ-class molecular chaperone